MYLTNRGPGEYPLFEDKRFTQAEYIAGEKWRKVYLKYLQSLEDDDLSDEECERAKAAYMRGVEILEAQDLSKPYCKRKRVLHAVNALCVYGEPDELGLPEFTIAAAKVGLADLVAQNF